MKKIYLIACMAIVAFTACEKEDVATIPQVTTQESLNESQNLLLLAPPKLYDVYNAVINPSTEKSIELAGLNSNSSIFIENIGSTNFDFQLTSSNSTPFTSSTTVLSYGQRVIQLNNTAWSSSENIARILNESTLDQVNIRITVFNNPKEFVGYLHNEILTKLGESPTFSTMSDLDMYQYINNYVTNIGLTNNSIPFSQVDEILSDYEENLLATPAMLEDQGLISSEVASHMNLIFAIAEAEPNVLTFQTAVIAEEVLIQNNFNLTQSEKDLLLQFTSVARYSAEFWNNAANDINNPFYNDATNPYSDSPPALRRRRVNWLKLGADALGAVVGGAVGGAVSGGAGTVAGGVAVGTWFSGAVD